MVLPASGTVGNDFLLWKSLHLWYCALAAPAEEHDGTGRVLEGAGGIYKGYSRCSAEDQAATSRVRLHKAQRKGHAGLTDRGPVQEK